MKTQFIYKLFLFFVLALAFLNTSDVCAALRLETPANAGSGTAFVARAWSDKPVNSIVFTWLGKKYTILARMLSSGAFAQILLPVPTNQKTSTQQLVASAADASTSTSINIMPVKRPVQKLQVDHRFVSPPPEVQERIKSDREKVRNVLASSKPGGVWNIPLLRPVQGSVSSQFGLKRVFNGQLRGEHRGLDLRGAEGTPIHACADGKVALVDNLYYSGNTVYVDHGDGVVSAYLHMSKTDVQPGQIVKRGQVLGRVGATGRVTGPHLHLSLYAQGISVDPLPLLEKPAAVPRPTKGGKNAR